MIHASIVFLLSWLTVAPSAAGLPNQEPTIETTPTDVTSGTESQTQPQIDSSTGEWIDGMEWWRWSRATGDWNGHRSRLESQGFTISGGWVIDTSKVESGGVRRKTTTRSWFRLGAEWDLEPLLALEHTRVSAQFYSQAGRNASLDAGDLQGFNNVDAPNRQQLAELWLEHDLSNLGLSIKVGKFDANSEFASNTTAGNFHNSSMGFSPTLLSFPSYPDPAVGVRLSGEVRPGWTLSTGIFDGALQEGVPTGKRGARTALDAPSDLLVLAETRWTWPSEPRPKTDSWALPPGKLTVGAWHHTGHFDRFGAGRESGTEGLYAIVEQNLWGGTQVDEPSPSSFSVFGQFGYADESVSPVGRHLGGGWTWRGILPCRPQDELGFAITSVELSDRSAAGFTKDSETAYELYYLGRITPWLTVQPDVQFIHNPGGDETLNDVTVLTLRIAIEL